MTRPKPSKGRVLVVDDEEVIASTLQEFLQGEGYECAVAADARSALASIEKFEPDLALCDVQLPGMDGLELLEKLLKVRPEILVLVITAYATVESAVAAFRKGAHDYLMKPVLFDELLTKLDRLMKFRHLTRENQSLRKQLHAPVNLEALVGESPPMLGVKNLIRKLGPTRSNVLITGESGTGKELVARALHAQGSEARRPLPGDQLRGDPPRTAGKPAFRPRPGGRSRAPTATDRGCSRRRAGGRSSSTRLASCRSSPRPNCSG